MQSLCALIFVVGGAGGASPRDCPDRCLGSSHLAACVVVGKAAVVLVACPTSPCAAARPMAGGGLRSEPYPPILCIAVAHLVAAQQHC